MFSVVLSDAALHVKAVGLARFQRLATAKFRYVEANTALATAPSDPSTPRVRDRGTGGFFSLATRVEARRAVPIAPQGDHKATVAAARNAPALIAIQFVQRRVLRRVASEPRARATRC